MIMFRMVVVRVIVVVACDEQRTTAKFGLQFATHGEVARAGALPTKTPFENAKKALLMVPLHVRPRHSTVPGIQIQNRQLPNYGTRTLFILYNY